MYRPHWTRLQYKWHRLLQGRRTLEEISCDTQILCPKEETNGTPAVSLPNQWDKVQKLHPETDLKTEKSRTEGGKRTHAATKAFHLRGATLHRGAIYVSGHQHMLRPPSLQASFESFEKNAAPLHLDRAACSTSFLGQKYFGHWLRDDTTRYMLAEDFGQPLSLPLPNWPDTHAYAAYFDQTWHAPHITTGTPPGTNPGTGPSCTGQTNNTVGPCSKAYITDLTLFEDFSQNSLKATRYRELRRRLKTHITPAHSDHKVYLSRGATGNARLIHNEAKLMEQLSTAGFHIIQLEGTTLPDMLSQLLGAKLVVTLEGSQQNHALMSLADKSALFCLQTPDRFNNHPKDWTECLGMQYGYLVGDTHKNECKFNLTDILKTADLLLETL